MTPIKVRNILPKVAIENKENLDLLQKLNQFYWNKIKTTLTTTDKAVIELINLGRFYRKANKTKEYKEKLEKIISTVDIKQELKENAEEELIIINKALGFLNEEFDRKKQIINNSI